MVRRVKIQSIYSYLYFFRFDGITFFVYVSTASKKEQKREVKNTMNEKNTDGILFKT